MSSVLSKNKKERLSFFVSQDLSEKVNIISKQTKLTVSEIVRKALQSYIEKIEKDEVEQALEEGYKANHNYYLRTQEEWKHADKE